MKKLTALAVKAEVSVYEGDVLQSRTLTNDILLYEADLNRIPELQAILAEKGLKLED